MVIGRVLPRKPAVKYTAKWLLPSLEGLPKCALMEIEIYLQQKENPSWLLVCKDDIQGAWVKHKILCFSRLVCKPNLAAWIFITSNSRNCSEIKDKYILVQFVIYVTLWSLSFDSFNKQREKWNCFDVFALMGFELIDWFNVFPTYKLFNKPTRGAANFHWKYPNIIF